MSNGRADASTVAFQESLRCFNVSTADTSQTSQFRTKAKRETGRNKKINLYHFFIIGHVIPNISTWGVGNEEAKNLNLKAYQLFVGPIQCHGIRYIALEFLFVNRSPLHFNHLWISHCLLSSQFLKPYSLSLGWRMVFPAMAYHGTTVWRQILTEVTLTLRTSAPLAPHPSHFTPWIIPTTP